MYLESLFCFKYQTFLTYNMAACTWWPWIQNLVTSLIYNASPNPNPARSANPNCTTQGRRLYICDLGYV